VIYLYLSFLYFHLHTKVTKICRVNIEGGIEEITTTMSSSPSLHLSNIYGNATPYIEIFTPPFKQPPLPRGRNLVFVEGPIGVGKSSTIEAWFSPSEYIVCLEPLKEMESVLTQFYNKTISPEETSSAIKELNLTKYRIMLELSEKEKKSLVVERCPYTREQIFRFAVDHIEEDTYKEVLTLFDLVKDDVSKSSFDNVVYMILIDDIEASTRRAFMRGRSYEKSLTSCYNEAINRSIMLTTMTGVKQRLRVVDLKDRR
jgi:deoxyadenosine/deoxycytidine kinase